VGKLDSHSYQRWHVGLDFSFLLLQKMQNIHIENPACTTAPCLAG
jgi:hypothetical protein